MAQDIVGSLFGVSANDLQAQRQAAAQAQARQYASMDPAQMVNYAGYMAGNQLGGAMAGMMGAKDPELEKANIVNSLVKETDMTDLESVKGLAQKLTQAGATREAMALLPRIDSLSKQVEDRTARTEDKQAAIEARKEEIRLRGEQKLIELKAQAEAALERAREQNASREQIAAMMADARKQAAQIAADTRLQMGQLAAAMKAEKPEKVDDKLGTAISVLEQQKPLITKADDLLGRIEANPSALTISGRAGGYVDAALGNSNKSLELQSDLKSFQNKARNAYLLLAKGTQTEGDASRAWEEFSNNLDWTSPEGAKRSIGRIKEELETQVTATKAYVNSRSPGRIKETPVDVKPTPDKPKKAISWNDLK